MNSVLRTLALGGSLALFFVSSSAHAMETIARQAFMVDATTGAILLSKEPDQKMPTSSMSKVMTMYMVFDALKAGTVRPDQNMTVSTKAWKAEGSRMFIEVGKQVKVDDLIKGVVVQSGNDAATTLAEGIGGTEENFAAAMNTRAKALGLTNSNFVNATGLPDPNHYSTARDLALLAYRTIIDYPDYYKYYAIPEFTYNNIKQPNRDPLLGVVQGADGMKTGHTEVAGFGLIGSGQRNGRRVIMVVNGLKSMAERAAEGKRLLEWGLGSFRLAAPFKKTSTITNLPVVFGSADSVAVTPARDTMVTVPLLGLQGATAKAKVKTPLIAPVKAGDTVGTMVLTIPQVGAFEVPLVAAKDVERKNKLALAFDKILQSAKNK